MTTEARAHSNHLKHYPKIRRLEYMALFVFGKQFARSVRRIFLNTKRFTLRRTV